MRLGKVIEGVGVRYCLDFSDIEIIGVTNASKEVRPGYLFVAVRGAKEDGHRFIYDALIRGAAAVAVEDPAAMGSPAPCRMPVVVVSDSRKAASRIASNFHMAPARRVRVIGVTGTNGKTTVTYFIRSILQASGFRTGLVGTIGYETGGKTLRSENTTPGPMRLHGMLRDMEKAGCAFAVMEVSSHALHQGRVEDVPFAGAVFTNLASDHLDYHKTRAEYLKAKSILFESLPSSSIAVLNGEDWATSSFSLKCKARKITYGRGPTDDFRFRIAESGLWGSRVEFSWMGADAGDFKVPMPGLHNAFNASAAAALCMSARMKYAGIRRGIEQMDGVPGRLTPVEIESSFKVFVDYAHTEGALKALLEGVRAVHSGRILLVFGCGGDRDRTKRPRMGAVAGRLSDRCWITSDNPRSEDPDSIIREIEAGMPIDSWYGVEPDREEAIRQALSAAQQGDAVIIAGKGHEDTQIVGSTARTFDDAAVARSCWGSMSGETRCLCAGSASTDAMDLLRGL